MISTLRVTLLTLFCVFSVMSVSHSAPSANATASPLTGSHSIIDHAYSNIFGYVIRAGEQSLTNLSNLAISPDAIYSNRAGWSETSYSSFESLDEAGSLSTIFISSGKDYIVNDRLVLGVFGQLSYTSDDSLQSDITAGTATLPEIGLPATPNAPSVTSELSGIGLLVGPYAILDLAAGIRLSGKLGYGESRDEITPYGTYSDNFDVSRILATGRISSSGYSSRAGWNISPSIEYMYYGISVDEYRDGATNTPTSTPNVMGNIVPSADHIISRLDFGPTFSRNFSNIVWSFGLKGSWSRWDSETNGEAVDAEDLSSRIDMSIDYASPSGAQLNFAAYYDGIGGDYDSLGISLGINYNF